MTSSLTDMNISSADLPLLQTIFIYPHIFIAVKFIFSIVKRSSQKKQADSLHNPRFLWERRNAGLHEPAGQVASPIRPIPCSAGNFSAHTGEDEKHEIDTDLEANAFGARDGSRGGRRYVGWPRGFRSSTG